MVPGTPSKAEKSQGRVTFFEEEQRLVMGPKRRPQQLYISSFMTIGGWLMALMIVGFQGLNDPMTLGAIPLACIGTIGAIYASKELFSTEFITRSKDGTRTVSLRTTDGKCRNVEPEAIVRVKLNQSLERKQDGDGTLFTKESEAAWFLGTPAIEIELKDGMAQMGHSLTRKEAEFALECIERMLKRD